MSPFIKEIEYFIVLCSTLNISNASEILDIQQSGLSKSLKKLESNLGRTLFIRRKTGLTLTKDGIEFKEHILTLSTLWDEFMQTHESTEISGLFKIALHPSIAKDLIAPMLPKFLFNYKLLKIDLIFANSRMATKKLVNCEVDFSVVVGNNFHPDLVIKKKSKESYRLYGRLKSLDTPVLYNSKMLGLKKAIKTIQHRQLIAVEDYDVIAQMASHSQFQAIIPDHLAKNYPSLKPLGPSLASFDLYICHRYDTKKTIAFRAVWDFLNRVG